MSSRITTVTVSRLPWDRAHRNVFYGSGMTNSNIYSTQFNTATYAMNLTTVGSFVDISNHGGYLLGSQLQKQKEIQSRTLSHPPAVDHRLADLAFVQIYFAVSEV